MSGLAFIRDVAKLEPEQRKVLVPLIAWQLSVEHPGFVLEGELLESVNALIAQLQPEEPGIADRLEATLAAAGVSPALLQELQVKSNLPPLAAAAFAPRIAPTAGQAPGGLAAQLAFREKK